MRYETLLEEESGKKSERLYYKSDIEIAQETPMLPIREVAEGLGIDEKYLELYGKYKAKIDYNLLNDLQDKPNGKLVLVTAITPTPAGEGKTTTTVGLADGLRRIGRKNVEHFGHIPRCFRRLAKTLSPMLFWG
jgi:Mrp family chromosome partitioning ATPase